MVNQPVVLGSRPAVRLTARDLDNVRAGREKAKLLASEAKDKILKLGKDFFVVNYTYLASQLDSLVSALESSPDGLVITQKDLIAESEILLPFDGLSKKDADALKKESGMLPSYSPALYWGGLRWPREGVIGGMIPIIGDTGGGKTTYLFKEAGIDHLIRYGEPQEHVDRAETAIQVSSVAEAISVSLFLSLIGRKVAIDSFRILIYGLSGNPMEGGMISGVFDVCTQLSNLYAEAGVAVIVAINPMLSNPDAAERLVVRLASATAGAIHMVARSPKTRTFRLEDGRVENDVQNAPPSSTPSPTVPVPGYVDRIQGSDPRDGIAVGVNAYVSVEDDDDNDVRGFTTFNI